MDNKVVFPGEKMENLPPETNRSLRNFSGNFLTEEVAAEISHPFNSAMSMEILMHFNDLRSDLLQET